MMVFGAGHWTGVGFYVPLWNSHHPSIGQYFISNNRYLEIFGWVMFKLPKEGHQSQPLLEWFRIQAFFLELLGILGWTD